MVKTLALMQIRQIHCLIFSIFEKYWVSINLIIRQDEKRFENPWYRNHLIWSSFTQPIVLPWVKMEELNNLASYLGVSLGKLVLDAKEKVVSCYTMACWRVVFSYSWSIQHILCRGTVFVLIIWASLQLFGNLKIDILLKVCFTLTQFLLFLSRQSINAMLKYIDKRENVIWCTCIIIVFRYQCWRQGMVSPSEVLCLSLNR